MSDYDDMSFEDMRDEAFEVSDILDKPDINDYIYDYEPEFLDVWEMAPVEDMSPGQIDAMLDMLIDNDYDDYTWEEILADMYEDFWDWYNENYGGTE